MPQATGVPASRVRLCLLVVCLTACLAACVSPSTTSDARATERARLLSQSVPGLPSEDILTPGSGVASAWGRIFPLAQAEQGHAPALWTTPERITAVWVGEPAAVTTPTSIVQRARALQAGFVAADQDLPLPPVYPYDQRLSPALRSGYLHLTWLDAAYNNIAAGARLWNVVLTPELIPTRGAVQITEVFTRHFALLPAEGGALWVVWSGGLLIEPALYAQYIDPAGRPRADRRIMADADWPSIVRDNTGGALLFWLRYSDGHAFRARLADDALADITPLVASPRLAAGDRLTSVHAGGDATHAYLVWNLQRLNGTHETWIASGAWTDDAWEAAARLGIAAPTATPFVTGFNGGAALAVSAGERWLRWAAPLNGQYAALAVAASVEDILCVVYLQAGQVVAVQPVANLASPLLGLPAFHADRDRHLTLAWSQPRMDDITADLLLTTTRP